MSKFKVGDKVFSYSLQEWGEVISIDTHKTYPLEVRFYYESRSTVSVVYYTLDGRCYNESKAPDLFFKEITVEEPQRPLQDKDIVMCYDDEDYFSRHYYFYDEKNKTTFYFDGKRNGTEWSNMVYVPDEEAPKDLVTMRDELED